MDYKNDLISDLETEISELNQQTQYNISKISNDILNHIESLVMTIEKSKSELEILHEYKERLFCRLEDLRYKNDDINLLMEIQPEIYDDLKSQIEGVRHMIECSYTEIEETMNVIGKLVITTY